MSLNPSALRAERAERRRRLRQEINADDSTENEAQNQHNRLTRSHTLPYLYPRTSHSQRARDRRDFQHNTSAAHDFEHEINDTDRGRQYDTMSAVGNAFQTVRRSMANLFEGATDSVRRALT